MPLRPCSVAGCPSFATYRGKCDQHRRRKARADYGEDQKFLRTKRWLMTSRKKLTTDPVCEACGKRLATEVDHIIPRADGGDPWSMDNLQSLCAQCHGAKTRKEQLA